MSSEAHERLMNTLTGAHASIQRFRWRENKVLVDGVYL